MSSATDFLSNVTDLAVARVKRLIPQFSWAIITGIDPLQIRLDGSSAPMHTKPGSLVSGLHIGDRVQVLLAGQRATIIGINGGGVESLVFPAPAVANTTIWVKREGTRVEVRWRCDTSVAAGAVQEILPAGGLPERFRQSLHAAPAAMYGAAAQPCTGAVEVNGRIVMRNNHSAALATHQGIATYFVD